MSEITIRHMVKADFEEFAQLRALALDTEPASFWNTVAEEAPELEAKFDFRVLKEHNFTLGAFDNLKLIGYMSFVRHDLSKLQHKGEIHSVFVHPHYRGRGISSQLFSKMLETAFDQNGLTKIMLTVTQGNVAAKALYEKHGFESFGLEKNGMVVDGKVYGQYWMQLSKEDWQA